MRIVVGFLVMLMCWSTAGTAGNYENCIVDKATQALANKSPIEVTIDTKTEEWRWVELDYYDKEIPLTVDLLSSVKGCSKKIIYILPASGMNFRSSFFFNPEGKNLAHFLREQGYLVVGITSREDNLTLEDKLKRVSKWGIARHRKDVRKIVKVLKKKLKNNLQTRKYDMLGYSFSSATVLDYAARYNDAKLDRIMIQELYSFNPEDEDNTQKCDVLSNGLQELIDNSETVDKSLGDLKQLVVMANDYPDADSGVSRDFVGLPGNFTVGGILHFWLVNTAPLPGTHTHITGLPRDWPIIKSTIAGTYNFAQDPVDDTYSLSLMSMENLLRVAVNMNSGYMPLAIVRDWAAVNAQNGMYEINWNAIDAEVVWINGELGYGDQLHAAGFIRDNGNENVRTLLVPGYGNADTVLSATAETDVWMHLVGDINSLE